MKYCIGIFLASLIFTLAPVQGTFAQDKVLVQVKVFDQNMNPLTGITIFINGKESISLDKKVVIVEIARENLPPKFIRVTPDHLETESWSYSKGILEVILRKRLYILVDVTVVDQHGKPLKNMEVQFADVRTVKATTNEKGVVQLPLAPDEAMRSAEQFTLAGHRAVRLTGTGKERVLSVRTAVQKKDSTAPAAPSAEATFSDFDLNRLDSINSLTVFYAIFKNIDVKSMSEEEKRRVDEKFYQLVSRVKEEEEREGFIGKISDSSFVKNDVENLLAQAKFENDMLDDFRSSFDDKIAIINQKLEGGMAKLGSGEREKLMTDLNTLEEVLRQNEDKFYKNITDYRIILSSLKESFSDIEHLESQLSLSERLRVEEQRAFQKRMFISGSIALVFGALVVFLILLWMRVQRQKKSLQRANREVERVNENLEGLVLERTRSLSDAHQEMDIFLYRASHDLRSPICSIIGLCNLALHAKDNATELVKRISDTALKMDGMLKKLRMISEINQPSNYSFITLHHNIKRIAGHFAPFIQTHNVKVEINCDENIQFHSYPDVLEIILYNLIDNALFFSSVSNGRQPTVTVQVTLENNVLRLGVFDNGIGIDEQIRIRLWDMFFVGHEHSKGNGLGLYIVFKSTQVLNGKIDVQTEANAFTKFFVTLPVNTQQTASLVRGRTRAALLEAI